MLEGDNIIIFSSDDWESGLKSSKYHIAIRLAKKNKVLFINSVGLRNPTVSSSDLKRIMSKLRNWLKGWKKIHDNLYIYTPIILPLHSMKFVKPINRFILSITVRTIQFLLNLRSPILLIFIPNMACIVGRLNEKGVVYYCIDELKGYKDVNSEIFEEMERDLLDKADCVIACSRTLWEQKVGANKNTYYVPHGVDWKHFRKSLDGNLKIPKDILGIKKPIIGYYGFISDDWIDYNLLNYIASQKPEWTIVLIGKSRSDISNVLKCSNILFLGLIDFEDLPNYSKAFDVAIIPFRLNKLTRDSNPLKLYEYLSSGLPVVSVNIPEVTKFEGLVRIADDYQSFVDHIKNALDENNREKAYIRSDRMKTETWEERLERISEIILSHCGRGNKYEQK